MIKSRKFFAAAALAGLTVSAVGLVVSPFSASAHVSADAVALDVASARIGVAFQLIPGLEPARSLEAAALGVSKGDLGAKPDCRGETWPNVSQDCLAMADGSAAPRVRYITVGKQLGEATTVLMRLPAPEVAAR